MQYDGIRQPQAVKFIAHDAEGAGNGELRVCLDQRPQRILDSGTCRVSNLTDQARNLGEDVWQKNDLGKLGYDLLDKFKIINRIICQALVLRDVVPRRRTDDQKDRQIRVDNDDPGHSTASKRARFFIESTFPSSDMVITLYDRFREDPAPRVSRTS